MRLLLAALVVLLALCMSSAAPAHHASWPIHKVWSAVKEKLVDPPPRPPKVNCSKPEHVGKIMELWDPVLKEYISWICTEVEGGDGYDWRRLPWQHTFDVSAEPKIVTWDWHRKCKSIVCKKELVFHTRHYMVWAP